MLLSGTVVSGDGLGRVNLLHFIALFVLWPLLSCLLLVCYNFFPKRRSFSVVNWLVNLPLLPKAYQQSITHLKKEQRFKPWLFLQSQQVVLAFSLGCLLSFFMVLLFSDVSFVWRSTLLSTHHIQPLLDVIAMPWWWLESAQPALALIDSTKENRMLSQTNETNYGAWWLFLLMAQCVYAVVPRVLSTLWARYKFNKTPAFTTPVNDEHPLKNRQVQSPILSAVQTERPLLTAYNLCCWLELEQALCDDIVHRFSELPLQTFQVGFHGKDEEKALEDNKPQLLLVAAWEPPMGELRDYLVQGRGVIMLVDHKEGVWQSINAQYVDEWRRFCLTLNNWSLYVDKELR